MSASEPSRSRVAQPAPPTSKTTRWPCRNIRKIEPVSAPTAKTYSARSVSQTGTPTALPGSDDLTTPCIPPIASSPLGYCKQSRWMGKMAARRGERAAIFNPWSGVARTILTPGTRREGDEHVSSR